jgi:hypothetical protein
MRQALPAPKQKKKAFRILTERLRASSLSIPGFESRNYTESSPGALEV